MRALVLLALLLAATVSLAHPGSAIAVSPSGVVYFVDTGAGVFFVDGKGQLVRHPGPAYHWFAFDPAGRFRNTPWPSIPGGELQSAGTAPTVILSSDVSLTIGTDGRLYYPDGSRGGRVRIIAVDPSGATSVHATLPPIRSGSETVTWINGLAAGPDGSLYYTEDSAIRRIDKRGRVSTVIANPRIGICKAVPGIPPVEGPYLRGLALAADGSIYVAASGCAALLRVDRKGGFGTVLRATPPWSPTAVATAGGEVFVLEYLHTASDNRVEWLPRIRKISRSGAVSTVVTVGVRRP